MTGLDTVYGPGAQSSPDAKRVADMFARDCERLRADLAKFSANANWAVDNRESLRRDYGGTHIAVRDEKICASHENLSMLLEKVREKYGDTSDVFIDRIEKRKAGMLLQCGYGGRLDRLQAHENADSV